MIRRLPSCGVTFRRTYTDVRKSFVKRKKGFVFDNSFFNRLTIAFSGHHQSDNWRMVGAVVEGVTASFCQARYWSSRAWRRSTDGKRTGASDEFDVSSLFCTICPAV